MARQTAEALLEKTLKKHKPAQALAYLSKLYATNHDVAYLQAAAALLPRFADDPAVFNAALWAMQRVAFVKGKELREDARDKLIYRKIAPAYLRFLDQIARAVTLPTGPTTTPSSPPKTLITATQILKPPHSPTMVALEIAAGMIETGLAEPLVLSTDGLPYAPGSTFHPPFIATKTGETGAGLITYKGVDIPIHRLGETELSAEKVQAGLDRISAFSPEAVLAVGDCNVVADLAARAYPVLCWPLTQSEPISAAHLEFYRSETEPPRKINRKPLKLPDPVRARQDFDLHTVAERQSTLTRADLKLPDDAFVYTLVGTRIADELTPEFQTRLARILSADPRAHAVIVGAQKLNVTPELAKLGSRLRVVGFLDDLRALFHMADVFLNPPRQGGGNGAYLAMFEHLPIATLDDCDVQMTIREDAAVQTLDELEALAIDLCASPDRLAEFRVKSQRRVEGLVRPEDSIRRILAHCRTAQDEFRRRGGLDAAQAA